MQLEPGVDNWYLGNLFDVVPTEERTTSGKDLSLYAQAIVRHKTTWYRFINSERASLKKMSRT